MKGQKSTSCGGRLQLKSDAYVSEEIEVLQLKFIDDFFCKASLAVKINHSSKHEFF